MVSVEEALDIIEKSVHPLEAELCPLLDLNGHVLAEDVSSPIDMPSFDQSAMDGYAFNFIEGQMTYEVVGEVAAGSSDNPALKEGEGVRIFTGAMVPTDANIVVQQELIERDGNKAIITEQVAVGKNIRPKGEQIQTGDIALRKGSEMNPSAIGFLSGLGMEEVNVVKKPVITLITTGNELVRPGNKILPGQIYESNSFMLNAALRQYDFDAFSVMTVSDDYGKTLNQIKEALTASDMVILTGGISVGDYDFVGKALQEIGAKELFYKINQKPGKPLYFGKVNETIVAALPGNPAAAMTCFYMYVLPALNQLSGKSFNGLEKISLPISHDYSKKGKRAIFLKAEFKNGAVNVLDGQSSAMLRSFAEATGLIYVPADQTELKKDDLVTYYRIK